MVEKKKGNPVLGPESIGWIGKGPKKARKAGTSRKKPTREKTERYMSAYRRRDGNHMAQQEVDAVKVTLERLAKADDGDMLIERFRTKCQADLDTQFVNMKRAADKGSEAAARFLIEQAAGRAKETREVTTTIIQLVNDVFPVDGLVDKSVDNLGRTRGTRGSETVGSV